MNKEIPKWEIKTHSYQIADTGDYDRHYELTNGDISLVTKDDLDEEDITRIPYELNQCSAKWEDWKLSDKTYELYLKQQEVDRWKKCAANLYDALWLAEQRDNDGEHQDIQNARIEYSQCTNELP